MGLGQPRSFLLLPKPLAVDRKKTKRTACLIHGILTRAALGFPLPNSSSCSALHQPETRHLQGDTQACLCTVSKLRFSRGNHHLKIHAFSVLRSLMNEKTVDRKAGFPSSRDSWVQGPAARSTCTGRTQAEAPSPPTSFLLRVSAIPPRVPRPAPASRRRPPSSTPFSHFLPLRVVL